MSKYYDDYGTHEEYWNDIEQEEHINNTYDDMIKEMIREKKEIEKLKAKIYVLSNLYDIYKKKNSEYAKTMVTEIENRLKELGVIK